MIKNESAIIERCISSALNYVDAVCIIDTGSIDNSISVIHRFFSEKNPAHIPYQIIQHEWKNFGHNRSLSFEYANQYCQGLGWNLETSWALVLDADMCLVVSDKWDISILGKDNGYKIMQKNGDIEYYNVRFLKLSFPWKCIGATHEYWNGDNTIELSPTQIFIHDIGDGGAKADKFERDIRLLRESLQIEPNNPRTWFYLGQSYSCISKYEEAIECYLKRISLGGWQEEVWYSMYMISKSYLWLKQIIYAEIWCDKAYKLNPNRSENLYAITKYLRETYKYYRAYNYCLLGLNIPQPPSGLFIETNIYKYLFQHEKSILDKYVNVGRELSDINP